MECPGRTCILHARLDVSFRTLNIYVINDQGGFIAEAKAIQVVKDVVAYLDGLDQVVLSIGLVASTMMQFLTYGLQSANFKVVCMEGRQVKVALSTILNKTDKNDTRDMAIWKTRSGTCSKCLILS